MIYKKFKINFRKKQELEKKQKKLSIDSQNSKSSNNEILKEEINEESSHEISENESESMNIDQGNAVMHKKSRIAQANKDIEAMNTNDKVNNLFIRWFYLKQKIIFVFVIEPNLAAFDNIFT